MGALACSAPEVERLSWQDYLERAESVHSDRTVVYVWADWSRRSVEMLPSIEELGREYEISGVRFTTMELSETDDLEQALADLGVDDLPAAIVSGADGEVLYRLPSNGGLLQPADVADAVDALLTEPGGGG